MSTKVNICMCTYRRPEVLSALKSLSAQQLPDNVSTRIIVADNDETDSARELVENYAASTCLAIKYIHSPKKNISIARNACLENVEIDADWVAFIDDDEIATPDWITNLLACVNETDADAVFGPVHAEYPNGTPKWMREGDYHSNIPTRRKGVVQTGHTCNAILNWRNKHIRSQRFLLNKGLTGGEDTEYFFRLGEMGVKMELCDRAIVFETVSKSRISFDWIKYRKIRSGQSYAYHKNASHKLSARLVLFVVASLKISYCMFKAIFNLQNESMNKYWRLRAYFHIGVISALFNVKEKELY